MQVVQGLATPTRSVYHRRKPTDSKDFVGRTTFDPHYGVLVYINVYGINVYGASEVVTGSRSGSNSRLSITGLALAQ
jgi:hypothetical protein